MTEGISLYNFYAEMLVSLVLFVVGGKRRARFRLRLAATLVTIAAAWYVFLFVVPDGYTVWNVARYIALFCMFIVGVRLCFEMDFAQSCYCCTAALALQHVICKINVLIRIAVAASYKDCIWLYYIFTPIMYAAVFLLYGKKARNSLKLGMYTSTQIVLGVFMLLIATVASQAFDLEFCGGDISVYAAFVGLEAFLAFSVLLIQFSLYRIAAVRHDMTDMESMHEIELKQMARTDELMNAISIMSHDLKHKLIGLDSRDAEEMLRTVSLYDETPHTENALLDAVLAQKSFIMRSAGIDFTPMIDASRLNMLTKGDMYSLFGNILDNAIEAVSALPEGHGRCVVLCIKNIDGFVSVHCENEFIGTVEFIDGLPATRKADKLAHGYGIKSMEYTVKSYGGTLSVCAENNVFNVDILLPYGEATPYAEA